MHPQEGQKGKTRVKKVSDMWSRPHFRNSFPSHSQMTSGMSPWVSAVCNKTRGDSIHSNAARWQPRSHQKQGSSWGTTRSWQQQCDSHHTGLYVLVRIRTGIVWPFWNVSVLGGKKSSNFHIQGKLALPRWLEKMKIPFTKEKSC